MGLNGCFLNSGATNFLFHDKGLCSFRTRGSTIARIPRLNKKAVSLCDTNFWGQFYKNGSASLGIRKLPVYGEIRKRPQPPMASNDVPQSFRYPAMKKKPRWWWRTLACLPYLMPLHETWMYAETAYHLHPFLADFEILTYPFLRVLGKLPIWFLIAYFFVAYLGIVRRKEWPHFFRFHVAQGMLLEIALQVTGTVSRWSPKAWYWGKAGMHFWVFVAFGFLFTVMECIRCALAGMYADIPFVCDAAYIQIPYE